jgi:hypothetical protein
VDGDDSLFLQAVLFSFLPLFVLISFFVLVAWFSFSICGAVWRYIRKSSGWGVSVISWLGGVDRGLIPGHKV